MLHHRAVDGMISPCGGDDLLVVEGLELKVDEDELLGRRLGIARCMRVLLRHCWSDQGAQKRAVVDVLAAHRAG